MLILGLLLLAGACAVGVTGILSNRGTGHQVTGGFDAFGRTMHGSAGQLFFWGIVVGSVAMLGLFLLLAGLRGDIRRRSTTRRSGVQAKNGEHESLAGDAPVQAGRIPAASPAQRDHEEEGTHGAPEADTAQ
jgi:hypothetical protein